MAPFDGAGGAQDKLHATSKNAPQVLICHGADDPLVPPAQVAAFDEQMRKTKVDWQVHIYGGAVHSFTNPEADKVGNPAAFAYNADADRRSWKAMIELFGETLGA